MTEEILGIGTDIIEIKRFKEAMDKYGQKFLDRLFTQNEQDHCHKYSDPTMRFAARFSAKEAVVKSLGVGFGKHIAFLDIEIQSHPSGQPFISLSTQCQSHFEGLTFHLSMSHCHNYATATVIALKKKL